MKCAVAFSVLLAGSLVLLADAPNPSPKPARAAAPRPSTLLDDLVRMSRAGESDAAVLAYAKAHRAELPSEIDDATLRWLGDSGVRPAVVRYMSAIDVRPAAGDRRVPEGVSYAGEAEETGRDRDLRGGERGRYADDSSSPDGSAVYTGLSSNAGDFAGSSGYDDFGYASYPFGYPYYGSPFPTWFVVDYSRAFRFRHGRFDHGRRDHRWDGGWRGRGGPRDAWRDRDHGSRFRGSRNEGRPPIARGGPRWGRSAPGMNRGYRGSSAAAGRSIAPPYRGRVGPGFRPPASGFSSRAPVVARGGGRTASGPPAGRGRR